ncbi:uncharacterized protein LOC108679728 isoform X2 [Hyalella azteca]|uniref:Uncharacterized protein LOC108679728 isoform X2 n=1 Tax=Hyalella azteca TaxID=294128 RepID=A0A979FHT6_HYAAZ|nr:uncharacterized protein LOC108679728 isoform X2 [Hyalella azteca]
MESVLRGFNVSRVSKVFVCSMCVVGYIFLLYGKKLFIENNQSSYAFLMSIQLGECALPWWDGALDNCSAIIQKFMVQNNTTRSYCGKRADFAGPKQKVITYCLFGNYATYASGFPEILQAITNFYPGWLVRLYTEPSKYVTELAPLMQQHPNLYVCDVSNLPGNIADLRGPDPRLWRVAVLGDETVDVFLSRDIDAVILDREVAAVHEFLKSGKTLHTMRDHPGHHQPVLTGMFDVNQTASNRSLLNAIRGQLFGKFETLSDQDLLEYLYHKLMHDSISHDSYHCHRNPSTVPFPNQRKAHMFVGNARYRNIHSEVTTECPAICRPRNHQDWKFC